MSYNFDGKIANQSPKLLNYTSAKCLCEKCGKLLEAPKFLDILLGLKSFTVRTYVGTEHFIYETKSGTAVTYCSKYCRNKHNHRFQK